jgi:hypothetical protein
VMALLHDFVFSSSFCFCSTCSACLGSIIVACVLFSSISDCMAMPTGWLFYFLMNRLCYDSEGETEKYFSWTEQKRISLDWLF